MNRPAFAPADPFRITQVSRHWPACRNFRDLQESWLPEHRHEDGFALWWLEQPVASAVFIAPVVFGDLYLKEFISDDVPFAPKGPLPIHAGAFYDGWPNTPVWSEISPKLPWHPGSEGILIEYDGGSVVVLEQGPDPVYHEPTVIWHCAVCHDRDQMGAVNDGPDARMAMAMDALEHLRRGHDPLSPLLQHQVAIAARGPGADGTDLIGRACRTNGPCADIARLRAAH